MSEETKDNKACCGTDGAPDTVVARPSYRTSSSDEGITLQVLLPGVRKEAVQVTSSKDSLVIAATRENSLPEDWTARSANVHPDSYELRVRLHPSLDPGSAKAHLENGILRVAIAKREEARPRRIEVN